uniref:RING-type E3 ubiquitin transferase n=1 Tax=Culicoides sonorensis TaxID=179676 RepID=A0A336KX30_CULSO
MSNSTDCVICCKEIEIFALGECSHPVCYNCMTRMRALINQNECPICRKNLDQVIMSPENKTYNELLPDIGKFEYNGFYKIYFVTAECQKKFADLLANRCTLCQDRFFTSFDALKMHIRKQHDLFFCDLCINHIKLFPWERRLYTKTEIGNHRRIGDKDVTSHRGHPLCEYCDTRFFDKDALYKHLRTEHFFCHICDADGSNDFYEDVVSLRKHFKSNHFLCEEGNCINEHFTSVFRSEIDLKAHRATHHSRNMTKTESKSVRNLDLNFQSFPRAGRNQPANNEVVEEPVPEVRVQKLNPMNEQDFPSLNTKPVAATSTMKSAPRVVTVASRIGKGGLTMTDENFPSLGPTSSAPISAPAIKPAPRTTVAHALKPPPVSKPQENKNVHVERKKDTKKLPIQSNHANDKKELFEDFPSLPVSKNIQKNLKLPGQRKNAPLIEYSALAKAEPKIKLVNTENVQKTNEKPKPLNLNITESSFPALGKPSATSLNSPFSVKESKMTVLNNKPLKSKANVKNQYKNGNEETTTNFSILHGKPNNGNYIHPPNEEQRNKDLKKKLSTILRDIDTFNEFQLASKMYINTKYTADTYFEHCRMVLGEHFNTLFPELLVLLPNKERQKALYDVLCSSDNVSRKIFSRIKVCSNCEQVMLLNEVNYHERQHATNFL